MKTTPILLAALLTLAPTLLRAQDNAPPFAEPNFLLPADPDASDYRPVLNAQGDTFVYERTFAGTSATQLYYATIPNGTPQPFTNLGESTRADWCWNRSAGGLTSGPVAFASDDGIYLVAGPGAAGAALPGTAGMIYPSWYPDCKYLAVDVTGVQVTAKIDLTGKTAISPLANDRIWAGFPSVNQANPNHVAFAGQNNEESNYYNEDLNYVWVTDRSRPRPRVEPLERNAPKGSAFLQKFQGRAGWWSPDGKWYAFESNRICNEVDGMTYAVFIEDAGGTRPPMQVTDCKWNVQHPKWFPPGAMGGNPSLIAAVAVASTGGKSEPFAIASFDVSAFVTGQ